MSNVAKSTLYDAEVDDIKVGRYDTCSAMLTPIADKNSDRMHCVVKVMRGWDTPADAFSQDDDIIVFLTKYH